MIYFIFIPNVYLCICGSKSSYATASQHLKVEKWKYWNWGSISWVIRKVLFDKIKYLWDDNCLYIVLFFLSNRVNTSTHFSKCMAGVWGAKSSVCLCAQVCVCSYTWVLMTQQGGEMTEAEQWHGHSQHHWHWQAPANTHLSLNLIWAPSLLCHFFFYFKSVCREIKKCHNLISFVKHL